MDQYWEMIAHERRERLGKYGTNRREWVPSFLPRGCGIIPALAVPVDFDIFATNRGASNASPANASANACAPPTTATNSHHSDYPNLHTYLLQLPIELFSIITAELDLNFLYTLSHCCRFLRSILRPEVHARFCRMFAMASWANTPLIHARACFREYHPPVFETQIPKGFIFLNQEGAEDHLDLDYSGLSVYYFMHLLNPTNIAQASSFFVPTLNPFLVLQPRVPWYERAESLSWQRILKLKQYFPAARRWVLRNLTQREYVYADVLTSRDGYGGGVDRPDGKHPWGFSFRTLVTVNTCWSVDGVSSFLGADAEGRWAGDCFDIVVGEKVDEDIAGGTQWVNVSRREWEAMVRLFREYLRDFGPEALLN